MRIFPFIGCMKKLLFTCILAFGLVSVGNAQIYYEEEADSTSFKDRLYFGGNFSLNLGNRFTFIDISPLAGYMLNEDVSIGLGINYLYYSQEVFNIFNGDRFDLTSSVYGGRVFARHNILDNYFAHVEFENVNTNVVSFETNGSRIVRDWVPGLFLGGGVFQPVFKRGGVNFTVLYNVLHEELRSPYNSAFVIRGGVTF